MTRLDAAYHVWFWREFELRRTKCSPMDFQHLFEDIMERSRPGFMRVRPNGREGDWKCDGLFVADGVFHQVYSPDEIKAAKLASKIEEDLAGAYKCWRGEMKAWRFVYNVLRGLPAQVPKTLAKLKSKYPDIVLDHMSDADLWRVASELPHKVLAEILGPPVALLAPADEHRDGRMLLIHGAMANIDIDTAVVAMRPDEPAALPLRLWPWTEGDREWDRAALFQERLIREALAAGQAKFAVFGLAPIPLCVHLGYVLSDRAEARLFQFNRDIRDWSWAPDDASDLGISVSGLPETEVAGEAEVLVRASVSFGIRRDDSVAAAASKLPLIEIDITVGDASVRWLRTERQLTALGHAFGDVLEAIDRSVPRCSLIHLFYAGPVPGAVRFGQTINPRTTPPVALYQYDRRQDPPHQRVLNLGERAAPNPLD